MTDPAPGSVTTGGTPAGPAGGAARRPGVLGVLTTPRWVLFGGIAVVLSVAMVFLGIWQLHRYQERNAINNRIDAHARANPVPVAGVLGHGRPAARDEYTRVTATGRYDPSHQVLVRARTVRDNVGYEILTPLRLTGGGAVLVDRGWLPPGGADTTAEPVVPAAPTGTVTVTGQVRLPESGAGPAQRRNGHVEVRRIDPTRLAGTLPYPVDAGYLTLTDQRPAADARFVAIPIDHENAAMNLSYIVQWWLFSGIALIGYVLLIRWEARKRATEAPGRPARPARSPREPRRRPDRSGDRVPDERVPDEHIPEPRVAPR